MGVKITNLGGNMRQGGAAGLPRQCPASFTSPPKSAKLAKFVAKATTASFKKKSADAKRKKKKNHGAKRRENRFFFLYISRPPIGFPKMATAEKGIDTRPASP